MTSFEVAWQTVDAFEGWLSKSQALTLWDQAAQVPKGGTIVEIGSHRGRSTSILACSAPLVRVVAIDPFDNPRWGGGPESRQTFLENLAAVGATNVELQANLSTELRPNWSGCIDLLFIDGAHDYATVADDFRWAEHVKPGGAILVHDAFSSTGVTIALYERLAKNRDLDYVGRTRSLALLRRQPLTMTGAARVVGQSVWFTRNIAVKICIRKGWRKLAAMLRQPDMSMPY